MDISPICNCRHLSRTDQSRLRCRGGSYTMGSLWSNGGGVLLAHGAGASSGSGTGGGRMGSRGTRTPAQTRRPGLLMWDFSVASGTRIKIGIHLAQAFRAAASVGAMDSTYNYTSVTVFWLIYRRMIEITNRECILTVRNRRECILQKK